MAEKPQKKQPARGPGKRFKPGTSGNPKGKPKGARSKSTIFGERIMQEDADAIIQAVVDSAKNGDPTAMRLCVERLIPVRKGRPIAFELPKIKTPADISIAMSAIVSAMAAGEITAEEASSASAVIQVNLRAIEVVDIDERLRRLEEKTSP